MKKITHFFYWLTGLFIIIKLVNNQPLGYFWFILLGLSLFLASQSAKQIDITDELSYQVICWLKKYETLSCFGKEIFIHEIVSKYYKCNNYQEDVLLFLEHILKLEPENETVKGLLLSIIGTNLINKS